MRVALVFTLIAVSLVGCDRSPSTSTQSSLGTENKQPSSTLPSKDNSSSSAQSTQATPQDSSDYNTTQKDNASQKHTTQAATIKTHAKATAKVSEYPDFIGNELFIHASDIPNSSMLGSLYWADLYEDEFPTSGAKPLMRLTSEGPMTVKDIDIVYDTGNKSHQKVLSNNFDWLFLGDKGQKYKVRLNLANTNRLTLYPIYTDDSITLAYIESEGQDMPNHPEDYSWYSCLYMYNKQLNKVMSFFPEGCVNQTIKRTWITTNKGYLRDSVSSDGVSKKNDVYTIKIKNTPMQQNGSFDMSQSKLLTFTFRFKPKDPEYQIELIDCDYRFRESNKPITEYTECDYSFE